MTGLLGKAKRNQSRRFPVGYEDQHIPERKHFMSKLQEQYPEIGDIKQDLTNLKDDVTVLGRHVKADGKERATETVEQMKARIRELEEKSKMEYHSLEQRIAAHPGRSVALAFVAGILASALLRR